MEMEMLILFFTLSLQVWLFRDDIWHFWLKGTKKDLNFQKNWTKIRILEVDKSVKNFEFFCCFLEKEKMMCACSREQFKFDEPAPESPESLATRNFSASGISSRTGTIDWDSKLDEVESTLKRHFPWPMRTIKTV